MVWFPLSPVDIGRPSEAEGRVALYMMDGAHGYMKSVSVILIARPVSVCDSVCSMLLRYS